MSERADIRGGEMMDPATEDAAKLRAIVRSAIDLGVDSAVVFVAAPRRNLELGAAAGVEGPPLDRLAVAVRDPAHPVARTLQDGSAAFDVAPLAPGGPALRGHLPLLVDRAGQRVAVGVLAVAYGDPMTASARRALVDLAARAAEVIDRSSARDRAT